MKSRNRCFFGLEEVETIDGDIEFILEWANEGVSIAPVITLLETFTKKLKERYERDFSSGMVSG